MALRSMKSSSKILPPIMACLLGRVAGYRCHETNNSKFRGSHYAYQLEVHQSDCCTRCHWSTGEIDKEYCVGSVCKFEACAGSVFEFEDHSRKTGTCYYYNETSDMAKESQTGSVVLGRPKCTCPHGTPLTWSRDCNGKDSCTEEGVSCASCNEGYSINSSGCSPCPQGTFKKGNMFDPLAQRELCNMCECKTCSHGYFATTLGSTDCESGSLWLSYASGIVLAIGFCGTCAWLLYVRTEAAAVGADVIRRGLEESYTSVQDPRSQKCLAELFGSLFESYTFVGVSLSLLQNSPSGKFSDYVKYVPAVFRPAFLEFWPYKPLLEYGLCSLLPITLIIGQVVALAIGKHRDIIQWLWKKKPIQVLFDICSIAVVKKCVGASICNYSDPTKHPFLIGNSQIDCWTRDSRQPLMAGFGLVATSVWYSWIVGNVRRRSIGTMTTVGHGDGEMLYGFDFLALLSQAKVVMGVIAAAFSETHPLVTALTALALCFMLLLAHGISKLRGPCVFGIVNRVRAIGLMLSVSAALFSVVRLSDSMVSFGVVAAVVCAAGSYFIGRWRVGSAPVAHSADNSTPVRRSSAEVENHQRQTLACAPLRSLSFPVDSRQL